MNIDTPIIDQLKKTGKKLTLPVILMRCGGLDGVAIQAKEYSSMLCDCIDVNVHIITGRDEHVYESVETACTAPTVIPRLDFYHPDSLLLFGNEFTAGPEIGDIKRISEDEWCALFELHKNAIRDEIDEIISAIPHNSPVIVFNLLSLRHAHPAAAVALRELIEKYPERAFLSHAADPDAERPEKICRIKEFVLKYISAVKPSKPYSGGPYIMDNLYHIVLNPKQKENFLYNYLVPSEHVFEMPDFLEFNSDKPLIPEKPDDGFVEYLSTKCIFADGEKYRYWKAPLADDSVYFLSPVRPVYRKRIKEAMLVAYHYGQTRNKPVIFVVTHPDIDDRQYFMETVRFANAMGIQYIHLGERFDLEKLNYVYKNMASLNTIGVVASSAGGWENALNEMAQACIPFFMSITLNSFKPLTERIGVITYGMDFSGIHGLFKGGLESRLSGIDLSGIASMGKLTEWIDSALDPIKRRKLIINNFNQVYAHLSHHAAAERMMQAVKKIHDRHRPTMEE